MTVVRRGKGTNSVEYLQELAASRVVPIPAYVHLKEGAETLWPEFAAARAPHQWPAHDLILLGKICNLEADIRKNQELLDRTGPIIKTKRDTPIANPLVQVIAQTQSMQLALLRMLSFGVPTEGGASRARANQSQAFREFNEALEDDEHGLLAQPRP
jgi:hypothetical protein